MTSGGQCVMTAGIPLMLLWSASSWDMHTLEVSVLLAYLNVTHLHSVVDLMLIALLHMQVVGHTAMPTLVLAMDLFSWMMFSVPQFLTSY